MPQSKQMDSTLDRMLNAIAYIAAAAAPPYARPTMPSKHAANKSTRLARAMCNVSKQSFSLMHPHIALPYNCAVDISAWEDLGHVAEQPEYEGGEL